VVNGSTDWPKQRLEKEIVRLGGSVVQNAGKTVVFFSISLSLYLVEVNW